MSQKIPNLCIRQSIIAQHNGNRRNNGGPLATQAWRSSADNNWRLFCSLLCPSALWELKKKSAYTVGALPGFRQWTVAAKAQTHQTKLKTSRLSRRPSVASVDQHAQPAPARTHHAIPAGATDHAQAISACLLMPSWGQWGWASTACGLMSTYVQYKSIHVYNWKPKVDKTKFNPTMNSQILGQNQAENRAPYSQLYKHTCFCPPPHSVVKVQTGRRLTRAKPTFRWLCALRQIQRVVVFVIFTVFSPWEEEGRGKTTSVSHDKEYGPWQTQGLDQNGLYRRPFSAN